MRTLVISAFTALLFSTGLALAQGSGAAGDIGSGSVRGAQPAPSAGAAGTVGQSAAEPRTAAPAPKAKKPAAKNKKEAE